MLISYNFHFVFKFHVFCGSTIYFVEMAFSTFIAVSKVKFQAVNPD